jgi:hypothetical protein
MALSHRTVIGCLAMGGVLAGSCSSSSGDELGTRRDVSMDDLGEALGCDAMRGTPYDVGPFLGADGPPFTSVEVEKGRDCYRDGRFVGRVHVFAKANAGDVIAGLQAVPAAGQQPACHRESLQVVAGANWAVVTRGEAAADEVRERIGGRALHTPADATTFVSYDLPCVGAVEPD